MRALLIALCMGSLVSAEFRVDLTAVDRPLVEVLEQVIAQTGGTLVIDAQLEAHQRRQVSIREQGLELEAFRTWLRQHASVDCQWDGEVLQVRSRERFEDRRQVIRRYASPLLVVLGYSRHVEPGPSPEEDIAEDAPPELDSVVDFLQTATDTVAWGNTASCGEAHGGNLVIAALPQDIDLVEAALINLERTLWRQVVCSIHTVPVPADVDPIVTARAAEALAAQYPPQAVMIGRDGALLRHQCGRVRESDAEEEDTVLIDGLRAVIRPFHTSRGIIASIQLIRSVPNAEGGIVRQTSRDTRLIPTDAGSLHILGDRGYLVRFRMIE